MWWEYVVGGVVIMHGIGHSAGVLASLAKGSAGFSDKPWIFSRKVFYSGPTGKVWAIAWLAAAGLFVAAGIGLMLMARWWPALAAAGAAVSLVAIVPWWNTVVPGARAGAVLDIAILAALLPPWRDSVLKLFG